MTCQLTDLSVQLYSPSPNRAFLSGISNILCQTERSHRNNKSRKTVCFFDRWRDCSNGVKSFRGKGDSRIGFHVLKEWNGSSEALRWLPPKGGRLCRPQPRRGGRASISAALEDTAVAFFGGLDPGNQRDFKTQRHPLNGAREHLLPSAAFPLGLEIRGEDEGKHWCFQRLVCPPCQAMSNIMFCQGYNVLLIAIQNLLIYINTTTC